MALISDCACVDTLAILTALIIGVITYFKWSFKYWERKNVPYIKPKIPFGTIKNPLFDPIAFGELSKNNYDEAKAKGHKHVGLFIFSIPLYMPIDPEFVKNVMTKDFDHFVDRGVYFNEKDDPISAHIFSIEGTKWKNLRAKLTPTFTSGKMKMMFQTLVECGNQLKEFTDDLALKDEPVDIKDVLGRFTTDIIGSCAFGLDCNSFKDPNSEFRKYLKMAFIFNKFEMLKGVFVFSLPKLARRLRVVHTQKDVAKFFMGVIKDTVEYREKNQIIRKDFLQLLIELKNGVQHSGGEYEHDGKSLTINELTAQAFIFLIAGYETSSTTMNFCLFELATNSYVQNKARQEINAVLIKHDGKITYDAISEMKYLGQVIDETLRKYPPVPVVNRKCVAEYNVPGTDVLIEKDTILLISVIGLHHDAEYFPDPERFDPERFNERNKSKIIPHTYIPFGEGPRTCIGLRFGLMQTKVGLTVLLKNYKFSLNEKTRVPLKMNPASFILSPLGDVWLNIEKIVE